MHNINPGLTFIRCKACGLKFKPKKLKLEFFKEGTFLAVIMGNECSKCFALQSTSFQLN